MSALVLYGPTERSSWPRWSVAAFIVALLHAGLIAAGVLWYVQNPTAGMPLPPILVDLVPVSASPETQPLDLAVGPVVQEAPEPQAQPIPEPDVKEELVPPTPLQEKPVLVAPLEQKQEQKVKPEPQLKPVKPQPVKQIKKQSQRPPAPRTTAAPKAEQRAPSAASAVGAASAAAASASYAQRLVAHLQRFKQYPAAARAAGQQGIARVAFTVTRGGGVSGIRLAGSSGHAALDAETLAMVSRAQPMPPFPPEITERSKSFVLPMSYFVR